MWEYLQWLPMTSLGMLVAWLLFSLRKASRERDKQWDEEEKRRKAVIDLYPTLPSYEERMGVRYGPKDNDDDK
jgi:hypothetical protein